MFSSLLSRGAARDYRAADARCLVRSVREPCEGPGEDVDGQLDVRRRGLLLRRMADAAVQAAQDRVALLKARFEVRRAELEVQKNELVSVIDARKNQLALEQAKRSLVKLQRDIESHSASGHATVVLVQEKRNKAKLIMDQAQQNIEKMLVAAPMDGLVAIERNTGALGEMMWPGMSIPDYRAGDQVQPGSAIAQVIDAGQM